MIYIYIYIYIYIILVIPFGLWLYYIKYISYGIYFQMKLLLTTYPKYVHTHTYTCMRMYLPRACYYDVHLPALVKFQESISMQIIIRIKKIYCLY